jgi:hypothetical protein
MGLFPALHCWGRGLHAFTAFSRVGATVSPGQREAGRLPQRFDDRADEAGTLQRQLDEAHTEILFDTKFMPNVLEILFRPMIAIRIATFACQKGGYLMKRALIGTIGVVALIAGVQDAYAQARPAGSSPGWEWYASVGPVRRGNQCVQDVDINRGYGFLKNCPAPQAAARRPARVARR